MNNIKIKLTKIFLISSSLYILFFGLLSLGLISHVFAQTYDANSDSAKSITRDNNAKNLGQPLVIKPVDSKNRDSDQEEIGRDAMAMILEISKSNILYEKNKSSAILAFEEKKLKEREKFNKEMKEYNERYNKKYLESFKRFQKMRGKHAGYSGIHSDYSSYLQQFITTTKR